jgi:hypothetical protein
MPVTEIAPRRLVLKSGSTTLTLDKDAGTATLQRKILLWRLKSLETPLSNIVDIRVDTSVDRASGVEICHTMVVMSTGVGWALAGADKEDAQTMTTVAREFLWFTT